MSEINQPEGRTQGIQDKIEDPDVISKAHESKCWRGYGLDFKLV